MKVTKELGLFIMVLGLLWGGYALYHPLYQAEGKIIVFPNTPTQVVTREHINTYLNLMRTKPVLIGTIYFLQLKQGHVPMKVEALSSKLQIKALRKTDVIQIRYTNKDPKLAADVVNMVMKSFIHEVHKIKISGTPEHFQVYTLKLAEQKTSLLHAQSVLGYFKAHEKNQELDRKTSKIIDQLAEFEAKRITIETQLHFLLETKTKLLNHPSKKGIDSLDYRSWADSIDEIRTKITSLSGQNQTLKIRIQELNHALDILPSRLSTLMRFTKEEKIANHLYSNYLAQYNHACLGAQLKETGVKLVEPATSPDSKSFAWVSFILALLVTLFGYRVHKCQKIELKLPHFQFPQFSKLHLPKFYFPNFQLPKFPYLGKKGSKQEDIQNLLPYTQLGPIPECNLTPFFTSDHPQTDYLDALNAIENHHRVKDLLKKNIVSLAILSSLPEEGKTTLAAQLGLYFAKQNKKVVLISLTQAPQLALYFSVNPSQGLTDFLSGTPLDKLKIPTEIPNLHVISTGSYALPLSDILSHNRFSLLNSQLKVYFDIIIYDTPSLSETPEITYLAPYADGAIFIIDPSIIPLKDLKRTCRLLQESSLSVTGVVLNKIS